MTTHMLCVAIGEWIMGWTSVEGDYADHMQWLWWIVHLFLHMCNSQVEVSCAMEKFCKEGQAKQQQQQPNRENHGLFAIYVLKP